MNRIKKMLVKGMNWLMLDCDTATLLITKKEFTSLTYIETMKLRVHLMSCKYCRLFEIQSGLISLHLHQINSDLENAKLNVHLTKAQKNRIQKKMDSSE